MRIGVFRVCGDSLFRQGLGPVIIVVGELHLRHEFKCMGVFGILFELCFKRCARLLIVSVFDKGLGVRVTGKGEPALSKRMARIGLLIQALERIKLVFVRCMKARLVIR